MDGSLDPARLRERLVDPYAVDPARPTSIVLDAASGPAPRGVRQGRAATPWGMSRIVWSPDSILHWQFDGLPGSAPHNLHPERESPIDDVGAQARVESLLAALEEPARPVLLRVTGTPFQHRVWRALLSVPCGSVTSYRRLADAIGSPGSARAVGAACAANPVALMIPCHRVVRESGELNGYRWGPSLKALILTWEAGVQTRVSLRR